MYMKPNTRFDRDENVWVWNFGGDDLFMDAGNWIRVRVEQSQFVDVGPIKSENDGKAQQVPFTVYASCSDHGLGLIDWWQ